MNAWNRIILLAMGPGFSYFAIWGGSNLSVAATARWEIVIFTLLCVCVGCLGASLMVKFFENVHLHSHGIQNAISASVTIICFSFLFGAITTTLPSVGRLSNEWKTWWLFLPALGAAPAIFVLKDLLIEILVSCFKEGQ